MAGTIEYLAPIDNASGKIFGKKAPFCAVKRTWGQRRRGCSHMGVRDLKAHPYTEAEQARKTKFGAVSAATQARLKDASKITADQIAFREQTEYKTLYQYVWHLEWDAYQA